MAWADTAHGDAWTARAILDCAEHEYVPWVEDAVSVEGHVVPSFKGMRCAKCPLRLPGATCAPAREEKEGA